MGYVYILREKLKNPEPREEEHDPAHAVLVFTILLIIVVAALFYDSIYAGLRAFVPL